MTFFLIGIFLVRMNNGHNHVYSNTNMPEYVGVYFVLILVFTFGRFLILI